MIEKSIFTFIQSLNASWNDVLELEEVARQDGLVADWAQASWEALVEASIPYQSMRIRLVVYGDGADCNVGSSRFSAPTELPTHEIRCKPVDGMVIDRLSGKTVPCEDGGYALDRFVSFDNTWFFERPPFDHALIECRGYEYVVSLDRLTWELVEVKK